MTIGKTLKDTAVGVTYAFAFAGGAYGAVLGVKFVVSEVVFPVARAVSDGFSKGVNGFNCHYSHPSCRRQ